MTEAISQNTCGDCGGVGRTVERRTVMHHVKSEKLFSVNNEGLQFCPTATCSVVYYSESGKTFTVGDVRELVTSKTAGDERPLCYCFGFTEGYVRSEITLTGRSSVKELVNQFIKERLCACEIRNPSGVCCLGEINRTVNRLSPD